MVEYRKNNWLTGTDQYKNGKYVEAWLDLYFADDYSIRQLALSEEWRKKSDREFSFIVEYKSGIQTDYTGNVFIETVSNDKTGTPGWVFTCKAKYLIYACIQADDKVKEPYLLLFEPAALRSRINQLKGRYKEVSTKDQNAAKDYKTWGLLVPQDDAKQLAKAVINLTRDQVEAISAAMEAK